MQTDGGCLCQDYFYGELCARETDKELSSGFVIKGFKINFSQYDACCALTLKTIDRVH
jgi:hypothetical protein